MAPTDPFDFLLSNSIVLKSLRTAWWKGEKGNQGNWKEEGEDKAYLIYRLTAETTRKGKQFQNWKEEGEDKAYGIDEGKGCNGALSYTSCCLQGHIFEGDEIALFLFFLLMFLIPQPWIQILPRCLRLGLLDAPPAVYLQSSP